MCILLTKDLFMRNSSTLVTIPVILVLSYLSCSCRKTVDYYKDHHQVDNKTCRISQIIVHEQASTAVVYTFTYNSAGDPVTVKNTAVGTGNPNAVFKYDRQGKLKEMIRPCEDGHFETWTKYFYNSGSQIIRDTQYVFGTYIDSIPVAHPDKNGYWVSWFRYDTLGRIIARTDSVFGPGPSTYGTLYSFRYDVNGNLVTQGVTYDSHENLLRTNKIWMFLSNNSSLANVFHASAYNTNDLPLSFPGSYAIMGPVVCLSGQFDVEYTCSGL